MPERDRAVCLLLYGAIVAELDYAFVAEYAKVESGKLTAVGASFTDLHVPAVPTARYIAIAGRIRAPEETQEIDLKITIVPPGDAPRISASGTLGRDDDFAVYDGKVAVVFAVANTIPFKNAGLYEVLITVDGTHERRLAFEVVVDSE